MRYPLISCIMPTADRRQFAGCAIRSFIAQSWPNKELVILDQGSDPIDDLIPAGFQVTYKHVEQKLSTGKARNAAVVLAEGSFIAHWDDDDWSHPQRLKEQFGILSRVSLPVTGYRSIHFIDESNRMAWAYRCAEPYAYALGTSLMYTRDYWAGHRFADRMIGEDDAFVRMAIERRRIVSVNGLGRIVARVHEANTSPKRPDASWRPVEYEAVASLMGEVIVNGI